MIPSARRILDLLRSRPIRYLPKDAVIDDKGGHAFLYVTGGRWEWSWTILQETKTADYRKRLSELRDLGYTILSFHAPYNLEGGRTITRHGYILIAEPKEKELQSIPL